MSFINQKLHKVLLKSEIKSIDWTNIRIICSYVIVRLCFSIFCFGFPQFAREVGNCTHFRKSKQSSI